MFRPHKNPVFTTLVIASFFTVLIAPGATRLLTPASVAHSAENRVPAPLPEKLSLAGLTSFPRQFDAYYQDSFGFREVLIEMHARFKLMLGASPSEKVLIGKSGWLFFTQDRVIEKVLGLAPFSPMKLEQERRYLEAKRDWLADLGIHYLYVVVPDKHTIYPDFLPDNLPGDSRPGRLDQLLEYLGKNSDIEVLDLRPALKAARENDQVYYRRDTHWTETGAFIAYQEVMRALNDETGRYAPLEHDAFNRVEQPGLTGDLEALFGIEPHVRDRNIVLLPKQPGCAREAEVSMDFGLPVEGGIQPAALRCDAPDAQPGLVFFRDSFGLGLLPYLKEHFRDLVHINAPFRPDLMNAILVQDVPTVVIEETVERLMSRSMRFHELNQYRFQGEFPSMTPLLLVDPASPNEKLNRISGLKLLPGAGEFLLRVQEVNAIAVLKTVTVPKGYSAVLRLLLDSPSNSHLRVSMGAHRGSKKNRDRPFRVPLQKGPNDIYLELEPPGPMLELRIEPDRLGSDGIEQDGIEQDYRVSALEIRLRKPPTGET